ncbi:flavodoxin domain-containing protein [Kribbella shirazensis]|uniref:Menaquinone-dependent protoporphyrinogen oxidase n=1 Tax=Kribbella shirazensis TaxID=1105143 RepID=A0A7X6A2A8_9ACTN|nr:flavodoxin domain-containing protein [Kribbella shirazensis]NIK59102.1 menaquinone-dependent protoporphyrinogen oxidase [Kribbella shirazensis]
MSTNVLVTYATKMGATGSIAAAIGAALRSEGLRVEVREVGAVLAVTPYDAVVIGSAIYKGRWLPEAVRFLRRHERQLRTRRVWLFHSGPIGASSHQEQPVPPEVTRLAREFQAPPIKTFAGDLQAEAVLHHLDLERLVGDSRDWHEIRTWSHQIASTLKAPAT